MSLKAEVLKHNPNKKRAILKEANVIISHIDEEIKNAYDRDECKVNVSVPITFNIPYMTNKNAQRSVYYTILNSLLDRGYIVKILFREDQTVFLIKWVSDEEEKDIEMQTALLAKHSIHDSSK